MTLDTEPASGRPAGKSGDKRARKYQPGQQEQLGAEMRVMKKAFGLVPKAHHVLDIPCSGGQVTLYLARKGYWVSGADFSDEMLAVARENIALNKLECGVELQNLEQLTYPDRTFDTVLCFRLFHHFPTREMRQSVVSELSRVAKKYVVISYVSAASVSGVKYRLRAALGQKSLTKFVTSLAEVKGYFSNAGFRLVKDFARTPIVHTFHVAVFERDR